MSENSKEKVPDKIELFVLSDLQSKDILLFKQYIVRSCNECFLFVAFFL